MCRLRPLLVLLDDLLQILAYLGYRLAGHLHLPAGSAANDDVEFAERRILVREVVTKMPASALPPLERGTGDDLRDRDQVLKIERGMPTRIVLTVAGYRNLARPLAQCPEGVERAP